MMIRSNTAKTKQLSLMLYNDHQEAKRVKRRGEKDENIFLKFQDF